MCCRFCSLYRKGGGPKRKYKVLLKKYNCWCMRARPIQMVPHRCNSKADFIECWCNRGKDSSGSKYNRNRPTDKYLRMKRRGCKARPAAAETFSANSTKRLHSVTFCLAGALQIENSEETDQGKYECVATNSQGVRYSSPANLYVRGRTWTHNARAHAHTRKDKHAEITTIKVLLV